MDYKISAVRLQIGQDIVEVAPRMKHIAFCADAGNGRKHTIPHRSFLQGKDDIATHRK